MNFWSASIEKQVGDRVQIMLADPYLFAAFQHFGAEVLRRSSVFHGLGRFIAEQKVKGKCCFEVGTWHGLTAAVLSRHFEEVVTVDIAHNELKHDVLSYLGIKNVRCIDIKDNAEKAEVAKRTEFDFAYLDGNHARDTETDFALVRGCGRVLFHECWPWQEKVWKTVHQMPDKQVTFGGVGLALWDGR